MKQRNKLNIYHWNINVILMVKNVMQTKFGITINIDEWKA